jgi:predicted ATPase/DNA-binding winged helix-turn-helix (wHTH) protein
MSRDRTFAFGSFRLIPAQRAFLRDDKPVRLGSRALDILIELVTHPNEIISKDALISRVWRDVIVDEGSLRVHIAALRRALGDDRAPHQYIVNVSGRGYCFVAPVVSSAAQVVEAPSDEYMYDLPVALTRMVGRSDIVNSLIADLPLRRLITIVGSGGVGKTRVALAVAMAIAPSYPDGVRFADLSPIGEPHLVPSLVASALGLSNIPSDPTSSIIAFVRDKQLLLVLDSCEHVLEETAALAERVLQYAPGAHILATSREPLRIHGERVRRLPTLAAPPVSAEISAKAAQAFPAVELFVERAAAVLDSFSLDDADAPVVAQICQKLDGIPLAIELVAGRVEALGIPGLAKMLGDGFELFAEGGGATIARHRTMNDTLEWSCKWLPEAERAMLCRLAIFAGSFGTAAVRAVVADIEMRPPAVAERLASLVGKSLVTANAVGADIAYRLLDTTRAYALEKLAESGELNATADRHAIYYRRYFERAAGEAVVVKEETAHRDLLANLRAALKWAFSEDGNSRIGAELASVSSTFFYQMGLVSECGEWTGRAIDALDDETRGGRLEIDLQSARGRVLNYAAKNLDQALEALRRVQELARGLPEYDRDWKILWADVFVLTWEGDLRTALAHTQRQEALTKTSAGPSNLAMMDIMVGNLQHLMGDQASSRLRYEAVLERSPAPQPGEFTRTDLGARVNSIATLAQIYWLQGYADKAKATAQQAVDEAKLADSSSLTISGARLWSVTVLVWVGDLRSAMDTVESVIAVAERDSIIRMDMQGKIWRARLSILNGEIDSGVSTLSGFSEETHPDQSLKRAYVSSLATGLARQGRVDEALATLDAVIAEIERHGGSMYLPEILRTKGAILAAADGPSVPVAEDCIRQSLECARTQSALAFELQAAISLARLWATQGRMHEARTLLEPIYRRFTEGFGTADLIEARNLLDRLREPTQIATS